MFRELRRKKQALSKENCAAVLNRGTSGVLALAAMMIIPMRSHQLCIRRGEALFPLCKKRP